MPTLIEIGRKIGCSSATISRILNNSARVSPQTRETVLRELRASGYQPRPRRRQRTGPPDRRETVNVVMYWHKAEDRLATGHAAELLLRPGDLLDERTLKDAFRLSYSLFRHILDGIMGELNSLDCKATLQVRSDLLDAAFLADLMRPDSRGILLLGEPNPQVPEFVRACTRPLVLVDMLHESWPDIVTIDNPRGISQGFNHLRELGHERIGFVTWSGNPGYRQREAAFRMLVLSAGLPWREEWDFAGASGLDQAAEGVARMLAAKERPTALLCACDYMAMGVIRAAGRLGLRIPRDLSVVGFDDMDAAALVTPPLTTIRIPSEQLGRQAVRLLSIGAIGSGLHPAEPGCEVRVRPTLVVRESTAAPPNRSR